MRRRVVKKSLTDQAYELIIEKIRFRELSPGDKINIEELSREFEVSRTPLREAISRLIQNGFLEANHNVGSSVAIFDTEKSYDLIETNSILLEGVMAVIFRDGIRSKWIEELQNVVNKQRASNEKGDQRAFSECSVLFHDLLIRECPNQVLKQLAAETQTRITVWVHQYQENDENRIRSIEEHQQMLDYLKDNKQNEFVDLLKRHNERAQSHFKKGER